MLIQYVKDLREIVTNITIHHYLSYINILVENKNLGYLYFDHV